jgi:hypothetical protein
MEIFTFLLKKLKSKNINLTTEKNYANIHIYEFIVIIMNYGLVMRLLFLNLDEISHLINKIPIFFKFWLILRNIFKKHCSIFSFILLHIKIVPPFEIKMDEGQILISETPVLDKYHVENFFKLKPHLAIKTNKTVL